MWRAASALDDIDDLSGRGLDDDDLIVVDDVIVAAIFRHERDDFRWQRPDDDITRQRGPDRDVNVEVAHPVDAAAAQQGRTDLRPLLGGDIGCASARAAARARRSSCALTPALACTCARAFARALATALACPGPGTIGLRLTRRSRFLTGARATRGGALAGLTGLRRGWPLAGAAFGCAAFTCSTLASTCCAAALASSGRSTAAGASRSRFSGGAATCSAACARTGAAARGSGRSSAGTAATAGTASATTTAGTLR